MKKQFKICDNPDCGIKFYRQDRHTDVQWKRVKYHTRTCQLQFRNRYGRGKEPKFKHKNSMGLQELNDCCNRYTNMARKKMREELVVYSSKTMTQEELMALVPSMRG
jgi:transposase